MIIKFGSLAVHLGIKFAILGLFVVSLSGCVTEQFNSSTGERVNEVGFDRQGAGKTRMALGLEYLKLGDMVNAKFNLEKAEVHLPDDPEVLASIAYFYEQVKNYEQAESYYIRAIEAGPTFGDALNNFGTFLCRQKQYERADELFNRTVNLPKYTQLANSFENAALCAWQAGKLQKAVHYFEQGLAYDPKRPVSLISIAQVQLELNDLEAAREYLRQLNTIVKVSDLSLYTWAMLELKSEDPTQYHKFVEQLNTEFPDSAYNKKLQSNTDNHFVEADVEQVIGLQSEQKQEDESLDTSLQPRASNTAKTCPSIRC